MPPTMGGCGGAHVGSLCISIIILIIVIVLIIMVCVNYNQNNNTTTQIICVSKEGKVLHIVLALNVW